MSDEWPKIVKLKHPVTFGEEVIEELKFRRGKLGDIKGMKLGSEVAANDLCLIAARMAGQPPKVIEMLDVEDGGEVLSIALDFYGRCLGAGKTS